MFFFSFLFTETYHIGITRDADALRRRHHELDLRQSYLNADFVVLRDNQRNFVSKIIELHQQSGKDHLVKAVFDCEMTYNYALELFQDNPDYADMLKAASFEPYGYAPGATLPSGLVSFDDASDPVAGPSGTTHDDVTMGDAEAHADGDSAGDHAESPVNSPAAANEMES